MNSFRCHKSLINNILMPMIIGGFMVVSANAQSSNGLQLPAPVAGNLGLDEKQVIQLPEGATIDGARDKIKNMSSEAGKALDDLMGKSLVDRTETEVGEMAQRKRSIMLMELQRDEAKLAKEIWFELEGDAAKNQEELKKLTEENDKLKGDLAAIQSMKATVADSGSARPPVVNEIIGSGGKMRAIVTIPGGSTTQVSSGAVLSNGMKILSISQNGVVVQDGDNKTTLGFNTTGQITRR